MEQYLPEDMRLEETSVRRSLMTSVQREQVERLLADDNEVKVKKEKEELKEEGRRRSSRHSTATRYKQDSESESAESDLEEMVPPLVVRRDSSKRSKTEDQDRQERGLEALNQLEVFDLGVKPKGGVSISIARQKPATRKKVEEILEISDSSGEEEVEEVGQEEERKTRSGRISKRPAEVLMTSNSLKNTAPSSKRGRFGNSTRRTRQMKPESDSDGDDGDDSADEDDDDVVVETSGRRGLRGRGLGKANMKEEKGGLANMANKANKVNKANIREEKGGLRRGLRTSARRVQTVDLD